MAIASPRMPRLAYGSQLCKDIPAPRPAFNVKECRAVAMHCCDNEQQMLQNESGPRAAVPRRIYFLLPGRSGA